MVSPVSNTAVNSLLRAQSTGIAAGIVGLKSNQQATQAIINQLQQNFDQVKTVMKQAAAAPLSQNAAPLPRGSLVDKLV
jgi:hypothetical protein